MSVWYALISRLQEGCGSLDMSRHLTGLMTRQRMTVKEAAEALDASVEAVRKRIERNQLDHERVGSRVYVYLDLDQTESGPDVEVESSALISAKDETIHVLQEQLEAEREARRRADTIIAQLTQANAALASRIPELEGPPAEPSPSEMPSEAPHSPSEEPERGVPLSTPRHDQEAAGRPWWRRLFGE